MFSHGSVRAQVTARKARIGQDSDCDSDRDRLELWSGFRPGIDL